MVFDLSAKIGLLLFIVGFVLGFIAALNLTGAG